MKKIPDNAIKVFEGVIFDVYQWPEEMFDGTHTTYEAIKKRDAVVVIAVSDGTIVLNHEEQPRLGKFIGLPSGKCELGFTPLENAKRELLEETGMESSEWQEWFTSDPLGHQKIDWNNYFYIAKNCKKVTEQKLDPGEKITTQLISFEEFLALRDDPTFRNKDLIPLLEKVASNETEKQKLKDLLGIIN